jgi:hypothetical protein
MVTKIGKGPLNFVQMAVVVGDAKTRNTREEERKTAMKCAEIISKGCVLGPKKRGF